MCCVAIGVNLENILGVGSGRVMLAPRVGVERVYAVEYACGQAKHERNIECHRQCNVLDQSYCYCDSGVVVDEYAV